MSATLQRRIKQLEKLVDLVATPETQQEVVLLATPASYAPAQELERFTRDVEAAKGRGAFVIVLVPLKPVRQGDGWLQVDECVPSETRDVWTRSSRGAEMRAIQSTAAKPAQPGEA